MQYGYYGDEDEAYYEYYGYYADDFAGYEDYYMEEYDFFEECFFDTDGKPVLANGTASCDIKIQGVDKQADGAFPCLAAAERPALEGVVGWAAEGEDRLCAKVAGDGADDAA